MKADVIAVVVVVSVLVLSSGGRVWGADRAEEGRDYWAYQKPVASALPTVSRAGWARGDLDTFVLAKLEAAGLTPRADATPGVLLRRLYFDVVGLPPSPEQVRAFVDRVGTRGMDAALATEVDALLASERFGERWGRHWLDVSRYAESSGKDSNFTFPYAWRYRDYVIDAFNADKPFDRFLTEQVAGDLLPYQDDAERARLLIATGYLAFGPKGLNEPDDARFNAEVVDEQIDAVTRGLIASTVACARCHDHPSDPFVMEDYYALAGVFSSTEACFGTSVGPNNQVGGVLVTLPEGVEAPVLHKSIGAKQFAQIEADQAALDEKEKTLRESGKMTLQEAIGLIWRRGSLTGKRQKYDEAGRALPLAMGVREGEAIGDAHVLERGELDRPRGKVKRGFPSVIELSEAVGVPADQSGRLEMARWLTHPDHPLTGRVMVNRVWRQLFGVGLVRTVDQFGSDGERPSHPALLDHLALAFVQDAWSVKSLVRRVVLSRTYRQASDFDAVAFEKDPDNRLLWRASKRRLDAESIRDAMLSVSGELNVKRPVGSLVGRIGDKPISIIGFDKRMSADLDGVTHRSIYLPVMRGKLPDALELFDFAEPSMVTGDRATTNVPLQSLYLMNSAFVTARSNGLAQRVMHEAQGGRGVRGVRGGRGGRERVRLAFELCFGREPESAELALAEAFLSRGASLGEDEEAVLSGYCQALLCAGEFRYVD